MVQQASFITSLVTSFVIFCILMVVYVILSWRPGNAMIYYPLRLLKGEDVATVAKRHSAFAWITESFRASEDDIVAAAGLDAAVYIHLFTAGTYFRTSSRFLTKNSVVSLYDSLIFSYRVLVLKKEHDSLALANWHRANDSMVNLFVFSSGDNSLLGTLLSACLDCPLGQKQLQSGATEPRCKFHLHQFRQFRNGQRRGKASSTTQTAV